MSINTEYYVHDGGERKLKGKMVKEKNQVEQSSLFYAL